MTTDGHVTLGERVMRKKNQKGSHRKDSNQSHVDTMCSTVNYCDPRIKLLNLLP